MATPENVVFKVKYGDNIKRINGSMNSQKLDLNLAQLRSKILECFKITSDKGFNLTYIDEDGDTVLLGDDADLYDAAIKQGLNPLRINIELKHIPSPSQNPPAKINPDHNHAVVEALGKDVNQKVKLTSVKKSPVPSDKPSRNSPKQAQVEPTLKLAKPNWSSASGSSARVHVSDGVFVGEQFALANSPITGGQVEPSTVHHGVECYKCGVNPIIGSYYKSYSEENCNYCRQCFVRGPKYPGHYVEVRTDAQNKTSLKQARPLALSPYSEVVELHMPLSLPSGGMPIVDKTHRRPDMSVRHYSKPVPKYHGGKCEVCGANPITGRSYKKKGKYNICSFCYHRIVVCCEEFSPPRTKFPSSYDPKMQSNTFALFNGTPVTLKDRMYFSRNYERYRSNMSFEQRRFPICLVQDVTIPVGTQVAPNTSFTKIWRIKNTGKVKWPYGTKLTKLCGIYGFSTPWDVILETPGYDLAVQESIDVSLDLKAPSCPGNYSAWYSLASPTGIEFGEPFLVAVDVVANAGTSKNATTTNVIPGFLGSTAATNTGAINVKPTASTEKSKVGDSKASASSRPPGNSGKGIAVGEDDDDDSDLEEMVEELLEMGYGDEELNRNVLRSNNYDLDLAIDVLDACMSEEDSASDDSVY